jgi:valyl-tRNA synthetase
VDLHKKGLIYRDQRLVNWDPSCRRRLPTPRCKHRGEGPSLAHPTPIGPVRLATS